MFQEHKNAINMWFPSFFSPFVVGRAWPARISLCEFDLIPFITVHTAKAQIKALITALLPAAPKEGTSTVQVSVTQ